MSVRLLTKTPAPLEARPKHRHESGDYLLDHEGRCWFCGRKPAIESQEMEADVKTAGEKRSSGQGGGKR